MNRPLSFLLIAGALLAAPVARAQTHAAHTHGQATLDIAVERDTLTLQLETPQDNLVGFERPPRNAGEQKAAEQALAALKAADRWVQVDPKAGCRLADVQVDAPALAPGAKLAAGEHADVDTTVTLRCADAGRAEWIDIGLASAFPRLKRIAVQVAAPQGQFKRTLDGASQRRVTLGR